MKNPEHDFTRKMLFKTNFSLKLHFFMFQPSLNTVDSTVQSFHLLGIKVYRNSFWWPRDHKRNTLFGDFRAFLRQRRVPRVPLTSIPCARVGTARVLQVGAICHLFLSQLSWCRWAKYKIEIHSPTLHRGSYPEMVPRGLKAVRRLPNMKTDLIQVVTAPELKWRVNRHCLSGVQGRGTLMNIFCKLAKGTSCKL